MRRLAILLAAALAGSSLPPSYADKATVGANSGSQGVVVSRWTPAPSEPASAAELMLSQCEFSTTAAGEDTIRVTYRGRVTVVSTSTPLSTYVRCEVNDLSAGGSHVSTAETTSPGGTAEVTGSAVWPARPVTVCVTSATTTAGGSVSNARVCRTPDTAPGVDPFVIQAESGTVADPYCGDGSDPFLMSPRPISGALTMVFTGSGCSEFFSGRPPFGYLGRIRYLTTGGSGTSCGHFTASGRLVASTPVKCAPDGSWVTVQFDPGTVNPGTATASLWLTWHTDGSTPSAANAWADFVTGF